MISSVNQFLMYLSSFSNYRGDALGISPIMLHEEW